jgi:hypothetical protein
VLAEVADGAEPENIGEHILPAERNRAQVFGARKIDGLVGARDGGRRLIETRAGYPHRCCQSSERYQDQAPERRCDVHGGGQASRCPHGRRRGIAHTRTDESVIRCGFAGRENVPGATDMPESTCSAVATAVCEVITMRAEKRGRAEPSPSDPRGGSYCMPPLELS